MLGGKAPKLLIKEKPSTEKEYFKRVVLDELKMLCVLPRPGFYISIGTINENLFQIELLKQLKDATETSSTPPGIIRKFQKRILNEAIS